MDLTAKTKSRGTNSPTVTIFGSVRNRANNAVSAGLAWFQQLDQMKL